MRRGAAIAPRGIRFFLKKSALNVVFDVPLSNLSKLLAFMPLSTKACVDWLNGVAEVPTPEAPPAQSAPDCAICAGVSPASVMAAISAGV
jgi:hypothetical protein